MKKESSRLSERSSQRRRSSFFQFFSWRGDKFSKVTWKNRDDIPHTVVSTEGVFKSRVLDTDETFSFLFDKSGSYPYFCSVHPKMIAEVVVK